MAFHTNENILPTNKPSTNISSEEYPAGASIVVSQYGGAASAAACSYDYYYLTLV